MSNAENKFITALGEEVHGAYYDSVRVFEQQTGFFKGMDKNTLAFVVDALTYDKSPRILNSAGVKNELLTQARTLKDVPMLIPSTVHLARVAETEVQREKVEIMDPEPVKEGETDPNTLDKKTQLRMVERQIVFMQLIAQALLDATNSTLDDED